ncbi:hypothetical protein [Rubrivivax gelatinosus]|uniref:hypothetical protein n=1 Tax=Rubrivivax gelatinosus TaxID=28068 RepID=UPI0005C1FC63|nr:hypothetical protein [Rubrivivax gelatinosus]MBG6083065.1 hypothetical protein [Rubrivivax gelatinosus]
MDAALFNGGRRRASSLTGIVTGSDEVICLGCGAPCYFGGRDSKAKGLYFAHSPVKTGAPDPSLHCPLHSKNERRFSWLKNCPRDAVAGEALREAFLQDDALRKAFVFCLRAMNSKPSLNAEVFSGLLRVADGLDLWSVRGQSLVTLTILLLTLQDVRSQTRDGRDIWVRFELHKPRGLDVVAMPPGAVLKKHFVNLDGSTGQAMVKGHHHEIPMTQEQVSMIAGGADWVSPGTLASIRRRVDYARTPVLPAKADSHRPAPTKVDLLL